MISFPTYPVEPCPTAYPPTVDSRPPASKLSKLTLALCSQAWLITRTIPHILLYGRVFHSATGMEVSFLPSMDVCCKPDGQRDECLALADRLDILQTDITYSMDHGTLTVAFTTRRGWFRPGIGLHTRYTPKQPIRMEHILPASTD